jgi:hypothetical protein
MKKSFYILIPVFFASFISSCKKTLDVTPKSEFAPANVLTTDAGIKAVLYSSYASMQSPTPSRNLINESEVTTDVAYNTGGAENLFLTQFVNFTWDPSISTLNADIWGPHYRCIRDANIVLENIDNVQTTDANKKLYKAEARILRAFSYDVLFNWFGPVPLRTASTQPANLARATEAEMNTFIEKELTEALTDLPLPGKEEAYGRLNQGSAYAILAKHYLNTKQWQKTVDACRSVISLNYYQLFPSFKDLFKVANEGNKEMIFVKPARNEVGYGNWFTAGALPPAFKSTSQITEFAYTTSMANFATQYRLRSAFVNSLAANDLRRSLIVTSYTNQSNQTIDLMATPDNARSFKYWDNATLGNDSGNDIPVIRYADILLSLAEALNELNGPAQESLDLINQVRTRAGINNLTLTDASTKDVLRDLILRERGWEFISEGKRREDLIRQGKFITMAQSRGLNAKATQVLFPIPQAEIDANKLVVQNNGY